MIGIILTLIIGFGIALLSRFNTSGIAITIGDYTYSDIPLYVITVGTYLTGLLLAWVIEVPQAIATAFQIMGLGHKINSGQNAIIQLQNKINKLEIENIKLQERNKSIVGVSHTSENYHPNIFQTIFHKLNIK